MTPEFGIEFVDEYNYSKLNNNKFVIISDANNAHVKDIKKHTPNTRNKRLFFSKNQKKGFLA